MNLEELKQQKKWSYPVEIWEIKVSSYWIDYSAQEDLEMVVAWTYDSDYYADGSKKVVVKDIKECYGLDTGKDYIGELMVTDRLLDHLSEIITERIEV